MSKRDRKIFMGSLLVGNAYWTLGFSWELRWLSGDGNVSYEQIKLSVVK